MAQIIFDEQPVRLANGLEGEPLDIASADPANFHALISGAAAPETRLNAQLFLPSGQPPPKGWPVVLVVPGSLGVAPSHLYKAELLVPAGIAACVLDPFGRRGVTSTVANQAQYSFAASAWDVVAAAGVLAARADIDAARIGAQGHSRGGSAVLAAACLSEKMHGVPRLHSTYAAYPWCGQQFLRPNVGSTRVRSIIGDRDEWCLAQQVQGYMQAMALLGADATCRIVAGAHHSFDRDTPLELVADASVAPGAPTVYIRDDGVCVHPASGEANADFTERELMLYGIKAGYGRRGAHIGSADGLADVFHGDMMAFWQRMV